MKMIQRWISIHNSAGSGIGSWLRRAFVLASLGCTLVLVGCATPIKNLDPAAVGEIKLGTPKRELDSLLGKAHDIRTGGDGKTVAVYKRLNASGGVFESEKNRLRVLSLRYNRNMHLEKKLLHEGEIKRSAGFFAAERIGKPILREEIVQKVRVGQTRKELIEAFGPPFVEVLNVEGGSVVAWVSAKQRLTMSLFQRFDTLEFNVKLDDQGNVLEYHVSGNFDPTEKDLERAPK